MSEPQQQPQDNQRLLRNRYQLILKLSEGSYGNVYKAIDLKTNTYVAIKKMKRISDGLGMTAQHMREFSALKNLDHDNIIKLLDQFIHQNPPSTQLPNGSMDFYMIFEFFDMDLSKLITFYLSQQESFIPVIQIKSYMYQMIKGIYIMHSNSYAHRDIKPQNILINKQGKVKIADMGLARKIDSKRQNLTPGWITIWYRPLEMLKGQANYTKEVDIWSLGCIFGEMCILCPLFKGQSESDQAKKIIQKLGLPTEFQDYDSEFQRYAPREKMCFEAGFPLNEQGRDLLSKMLEINPSKRITAKQCLEHPFFDEVKNLSLEEIQEKTKQSIPECKQLLAEHYRKNQEQIQRQKEMQEQAMKLREQHILQHQQQQQQILQQQQQQQQQLLLQQQQQQQKQQQQQQLQEQQEQKQENIQVSLTRQESCSNQEKTQKSDSLEASPEYDL